MGVIRSATALSSVPTNLLAIALANIAKNAYFTQFLASLVLTLSLRAQCERALACLKIKPRTFCYILDTLHGILGLGCGLINFDKTCIDRADQGFPKGAPTSSGGGAVRQPIIRPNLPENCMKMKKIEPRGGGELPKFVYVDQPLIETYIALSVVVNVSVIFI